MRGCVEHSNILQGIFFFFFFFFYKFQQVSVEAKQNGWYLIFFDKRIMINPLPCSKFNAVKNYPSPQLFLAISILFAHLIPFLTGLPY